jgi:hypothetical protein
MPAQLVDKFATQFLLLDFRLSSGIKSCISSFGYIPSFSLSAADLSPTLHPALEDGTDRGFRNVGRTQTDAGDIPKRRYTTQFLLL